MPRPSKDAGVTDPLRIALDNSYKVAFKTEFEENSKPLNYFYKSIQEFHIVALSQILKRFQFNDSVFHPNVIDIVKPQNARALTTKSLFHLFE